jgi:isopenicillin N synthase-like dioxygenase
MEIGRDWDTTWKNKWPPESDVPKFKQTMLQFFQTCHELHTVVMRSIALGLDLDEMFFEDKVNDQCHNMRLLSYPPIRSALLREEGQARAGAHSGGHHFPNQRDLFSLNIE